MTQMKIVKTVPEVRSLMATWGESVALVPTMGALHAGHMALMDLARQHGRRVIASIFVNPAQFAAHEDLSKYPRPFSADVAKLEAAGVDGLFAPEPATMYPPGFCSGVQVAGPANVGLEDRFRPTHFYGVTTVVAKLFHQVQPTAAVFGEKDFQQLAVLRQMVDDLDFPVKIVNAPTYREADGLALSSRNVFLTPDQRAIAPVLHQTLQDCAKAVRAGETQGLARGRSRIEEAGFLLDYLELRDSRTLGEPGQDATREAGGLRLLVAAKLGTTRLIDNVAV
ncbi:MAG: pantoate--beta-alanine ligase [Hyphomicrobiales bacterium]|nr:pantoate--beta-alanine ligase [Hyphomicrobiales bacterium]MDE2115666.1 pantoate--beta-alanine ligase [Hyphomicrobiales bacterium]